MNKSLLRATHFLQILMQSKEPMSMSELAKAANMDKSTASRFLSSMESLGYLRRNPENRKFYLGLKLFEWGCKAVEDIGLRRIAVPHMQAVERIINEHVDLTVLRGAYTAYLDKIESTQNILVQTHVGGVAPAHCVSGGKAMLAYLPELVERIIESGLIQYTPHTITEPDRFRQECEKVRNLGYAISREEYREGAIGIGAPIFDPMRRSIGAVSTGIPISRAEKLQKIIDSITSCARSISQELGGRE